LAAGSGRRVHSLLVATPPGWPQAEMRALDSAPHSPGFENPREADFQMNG